MADTIKLHGRLFIRGEIHADSGLHIGGSDAGITIGTYNSVIVDLLSGQPYIPGSSLKGKLRSLTERYLGYQMFEHAGVKHIHTAEAKGQIKEKDASKIYTGSVVAQMYGVPAQSFNAPTRLTVRDIPLKPESAQELLDAKSELPFTALKTEVSIDRVTAQANPRTNEIVPKGAVFGPMELILNIYSVSGETETDKNGNPIVKTSSFGWDNDVRFIETLIDGMALLEDDYLGGHGSRGSGRISFRDLYVSLRLTSNYVNEDFLLTTSPNQGIDLPTLFQRRDELIQAVTSRLEAASP